MSSSKQTMSVKMLGSSLISQTGLIQYEKKYEHNKFD